MLDDVDALLSTTRAVRKRLDMERPVEKSVIMDCIDLSQQAPTGSNRQGWRWVVVTDAEKRAHARIQAQNAVDASKEMAALKLQEQMDAVDRDGAPTVSEAEAAKV